MTRGDFVTFFIRARNSVLMLQNKHIYVSHSNKKKIAAHSSTHLLTSGIAVSPQGEDVWCLHCQWKCPPGRPNVFARLSRHQTEPWCGLAYLPSSGHLLQTPIENIDVVFLLQPFLPTSYLRWQDVSKLYIHILYSQILELFCKGTDVVLSENFSNFGAFKSYKIHLNSSKLYVQEYIFSLEIMPVLWWESLFYRLHECLTISRAAGGKQGLESAISLVLTVNTCNYIKCYKKESLLLFYFF